MANTSLTKGKKNKDDELYTQLSDIEKELRHYKKDFKDKTVLCNCDDPFESAFFKYFVMNFKILGLKKLIATCYAGSPIVYTQLSFFDDMEVTTTAKTDKKPYKIEITDIPDMNGDGAIDLTDVKELIKSDKNVLSLLKGDGDYKSDECIELLKQCDVVVTNPPFSSFRQYYLPLLMKYKKKFLVISPLSALHYKETFQLIQNNEIWLGYTAPKKFMRPDGSMKSFGNICWLTNLYVSKRHENLIMYKQYNPEDYPQYLNFDGIEVNEVANIPVDYFGNMGVFESFLFSYNPEQFELVGLAEGELGKSIGFSANLTEEECKALFREYKSFRRGNPIFRDKKGKLHKPFARIIIRRKLK